MEGGSDIIADQQIDKPASAQIGLF